MWIPKAVQTAWECLKFGNTAPFRATSSLTTVPTASYWSLCQHLSHSRWFSSRAARFIFLENNPVIPCSKILVGFLLHTKQTPRFPTWNVKVYIPNLWSCSALHENTGPLHGGESQSRRFPRPRVPFCPSLSLANSSPPASTQPKGHLLCEALPNLQAGLVAPAVAILLECFCVTAFLRLGFLNKLLAHFYTGKYIFNGWLVSQWMNKILLLSLKNTVMHHSKMELRLENCLVRRLCRCVSSSM